MSSPIRQQSIKSDTDITIVLSKLRSDLLRSEFSEHEMSSALTAASELMHNILKYAGHGRIRYVVMEEAGKIGVEFLASDRGPGIKDVEKAMADNFSSSGTLGMGLPGTKRMVDEFNLQTKVGTGTTVAFKIWKS